jgi:TonB family protein
MPNSPPPAQPPEPNDNPSGGPGGDSDSLADGGARPVKLRTGRFGELEEHELIHLIDSLDDERSRARFRESIYISVIIWIAIGWFLFYGPRVLFHQPVLRDPIAMMRQHDKEQLTYLNPPTAPAPRLNQKTIQQLQKQAREAPPPTPQPPAPRATPPPQEEARATIAPPVAQPAIPLPSAPKPAQALPDLPTAPKPSPTIAQNSQSAGSAIRDAMRGAIGGRSGAEIGGPGRGGPLQAGATILSDIGDWDPSAYMRKLHDDIQRNWGPLIPGEVEPPLMKKGIVGIRFIILRDGEIGDVKLETASGDVALDKAAWNAITSEGQFPQLPKDYHGQQLELRVGFFYNEPIHQ